MLETNSIYHKNGVHGGPAIDRFQLLDEKYDIYDYILYLDTDVLISPKYPDIFEAHPDCIVAGHNILHPRDEELLANGWLKHEVEAERYRRSYFHGDIILLSREFRCWLRKNVDPMIINEDKGKWWDRDGSSMKWPVYDQSLFAYWLTNSPFDLTPLDSPFYSAPGLIHEGGKKTQQVMERFFDAYNKISHGWLTEGFC